jgi:hypothetical protein
MSATHRSGCVWEYARESVDPLWSKFKDAPGLHSTPRPPHGARLDSPRTTKHQPLLNAQRLTHALNVRDEVPGRVLAELGSTFVRQFSSVQSFPRPHKSRDATPVCHVPEIYFPHSPQLTARCAPHRAGPSGRRGTPWGQSRPCRTPTYRLRDRHACEC